MGAWVRACGLVCDVVWLLVFFWCGFTCVCVRFDYMCVRVVCVIVFFSLGGDAAGIVVCVLCVFRVCRVCLRVCFLCVSMVRV